MELLGAKRTATEGDRRASRPPAAILAEALGALRPTVTEFLEGVVNEPIYADKLDQFETLATVENRLGVAAGHPVLRRLTILRGSRSSRPYVYADTILVIDRLPEGTRRQLNESNDPIGRVIVEHDLQVERRDLAPIPPLLDASHPKFSREAFYARKYRIDLRGAPVMEISEWFLSDLAHLLVRRG